MKYFSNRFQNAIVKSFSSILILLGLTLPMMAGSWTQKQKITSVPRGVGAQFGNAVALDGNTMVVGARFDGTTASQAGAVFVYVRSGIIWTQQAKLLAGDGTVADKFGYSVAISGDTIVVGAFNADAPLSNGGAAYVFVRNGTNWTQQQKLTAGDGTASDEFGNAVAITGDRLFVGAHFADLPSNSEAGAVYLFTRGGTVWTQVQKLIPVGGVVLGDHFGEALAVSGSKLAVGSPGADIPFTSAGSVYVFVDSGGQYSQQDKISIPDGRNGDSFGFSVAIEGNTLVGGAKEYTPIVGQTAYGAAYVYQFNGVGWLPQGRLAASDGAQFDRFGYSVAVSGDTIAVGAREDDTPAGPDAGSAYIFTRSGAAWTQQQKLAPTDTFNGDRFGVSVALNSGNLVVGAAEKALTVPNGQGAAYYFTLLKPALFDFDGDGQSDISIFRPSTGQWWYQQSSNNSVRASVFGLSSDKIAPADFDGDGKTDIAIFRPLTGEWFILRSADSTFYSLLFGIVTDAPVPADYDGDGKADVAVFRRSNGTWFINKSSGGIQIGAWGGVGDIPVPADYDGDGQTDLAIYRTSSGQWWINRTTAGIVAAAFGIITDKPVPADYTGDGKADIAVWRPSNGNWYVLKSEDSSFFAAPFGSNGDIPVAGDYDGDGKSDFAVFRPNGANWFIQRSTQGILIQNFGDNSDFPVPAAYVPSASARRELQNCSANRNLIVKGGKILDFNKHRLGD